mgnify:CR=1 FL=1
MQAAARSSAPVSGCGGRLVLTLTAEMRCVGQAFEVPVLFEECRAGETPAGAADVHERFGEAHQRVYFFGGETDKPIEFVSFASASTAPLESCRCWRRSEAGGNAARVRSTVFDGKGLAGCALVAPAGARTGRSAYRARR